MLVKRFGRKLAALLKQKLIKNRHHTRIEPDRILHEHNNLNTDVVNIELGVHFIFKKLYDS